MKKPRRIHKYDVYAIPGNRIYVDPPFNCRGEFTLQSCQDLAHSIRDRGLDIPLFVQPVEDVEGGLPPGFDFRLIAGFRREKAIRVFLKWEKIPCVIRKGLSEDQAHMLNFTENLERRDLTLMEEATWLSRRYPEGVSLRVAAKELKRPTRWVHTRLRLLQLPKTVQKQAATGLLSDTNVETIVQLGSSSEQIKMAKAIVAARRKYGRNAPISKLGYGRRRFRLRKTKTQISAMIAKMFELGIEGLAPRFGSWCAGYMDDAELDKEMMVEAALVRERKLLAVV